jgi:threonine dehydrogenase-like Zn-dependent dehydrogenase
MTAAAHVATAAMRAAVVTAPGTAAVERRARPEPGADDVLVRIEGCGICASTLPLWEGRPWFAYPLEAGAPGHEAWGRLQDERRVAILTDRGFAEWAAVPAAHVTDLPSELDDLPFPAEAFACAVNIVRRAAVEPGQAVAIVGMGFLGSAVAQLCRARDAEVVEVRRHSDVDGIECERVIECAGTQAALDTASGLVGTRGRLVVAGFHQDGPRTIDLQSWNWRGLDVVNAHERDPAVYVETMREAARLAAAGVLDVERLVTHRFPLERLDEAFEAARTRPRGFVKAWVTV